MPLALFSIFCVTNMNASNSPIIAPRATIPAVICSLFSIASLEKAYASIPIETAIFRTAVGICSFFFLNLSPRFSKNSERLSDIVFTDFLTVPNNPVTSSIDFPTLISAPINAAICKVFQISVIVTFSSPVSRSEIKLKTNVRTPLSGLNILRSTSPSLPQPSLINRFITHVPNSAKLESRSTSFSSNVPSPLVSAEKKPLIASTICWKN